jgi:lipopolysaccharide export system protein LptA
MRRTILLLLALVAGRAAAAAKGGEPVAILPGGDAKSPISIEADRLDYFEKQGKAVYDGHVVVVQGDSRLTCSRLAIFLDKASGPAKPAAAPGGANASSGLKHMDCAGPVKVTSKAQTATAESGSYDKDRNEVVLSGHVVLTDGRNITKGDRLVYDLDTGQAVVQGGGSRVQGLFLPGSVDSSGAPKKK